MSNTPSAAGDEPVTETTIPTNHVGRDGQMVTDEFTIAWHQRAAAWKLKWVEKLQERGSPVEMPQDTPNALEWSKTHRYHPEPQDEAPAKDRVEWWWQELLDYLNVTHGPVWACRGSRARVAFYQLARGIVEAGLADRVAALTNPLDIAGRGHAIAVLQRAVAIQKGAPRWLVIEMEKPLNEAFGDERKGDIGDFYIRYGFEDLRDEVLGISPTLAAAVFQSPTPKGEPLIWKHAERSYSIDGGWRQYQVSIEDDNLLTAFIHNNFAMDTSTLEDKSGVTNVSRVIKGLTSCHGGVFAPAIGMPTNGNKGGGGYFINVKEKPKITQKL